MKKEKSEKKPQMYRITRNEWMQYRRDQKTKREIKRIVLELFDKVKQFK